VLKTIWFDVTLICTWNGPPVGIVRVQSETARHLLSEFGGQTRFCRFVEKRETHIEVSPKDVETRILMLDEYVGEPAPNSPKGAGSKVKDFIKKVIRYFPHRIETGMIQSMSACRRGITRMERITLNPIGRCLAFLNLIPAGIDTQCERGDVYINLDIDFMNDCFLFMYRAKKEKGIKVVGMCHDLIPINTPQFFANDFQQPFSRFFRRMVRNADMIVCNSRYTLHDLETFMSSVRGGRASLGVIPLGGDLKPVKGECGKRVNSLCRTPYILYVSTIEVRKNQAILYRAYKELLHSGRRDLPRLIFAGRLGGKVVGLISNIHLDPEEDDLSIMLDNVNDAELSYLYRHCLFTVYPSLSEGWGLPVGESLAYGKFCIASSASSLPEVG